MFSIMFCTFAFDHLLTVNFKEGSFGNDFLYIQQPVGITEYPGDLGYYTVS